ncbi:hypothetical protein Droror1_Dr00022990 [Drosera rotundifolia]
MESNDVETLIVDGVTKSSTSVASSDGETKTQTTLLSILLQQASIYGIAAGYCISASLLSIINKWGVMKFPYSGALTALQYFRSPAGVLLAGSLGWLEHDKLDFLTMWQFLPAAVEDLFHPKLEVLQRIHFCFGVQIPAVPALRK